MIKEKTILPVIESKNIIEISIEEYTRLKDIETRFQIIRDQMLHAEYCPIHTQIILGIEKEYKKHEWHPLLKQNGIDDGK